MKKIFYGIMGVITFMFIGVPNTYAQTTISQTDFDTAKTGTESNGVRYTEASGYKWYSLTSGEEFTLGSDIDLEDAFLDIDNNTINLSGKTITGSGDLIINSYATNLTISGVGTIETTSSTSDTVIGITNGKTTLNGNITYKGGVVMEAGDGDTGSLTINDGTFNGTISASGDSTVTINNGTFETTGVIPNLMIVDGTLNVKVGTFNAPVASNMYVYDATATISGGSFTSGDNGIESEGSTINISGGTFKGNDTGIFLTDCTAKLSGGTYTGNTTAIRVGGTTTIDGILAPGYVYSAGNSSSTDSGMTSLTAKTTSVISAESGTTVSTTSVISTESGTTVSTTSVISTESGTTVSTTSDNDSTNSISNPQTGDNVLLYAGLGLISLIGLAGSTLYLKKREN